MINIYNAPPKTAKIIDIAGKIVANEKYTPAQKVNLNDKLIDIKARGAYPYNLLSNFSATNFVLDGVKIKSLEGFLQSLKINNPEKQCQMCLLGGFDAKKMSKSIKQSENDMMLFWNGKTFLKGSEEYQYLKKSVIEASKNSKDGFFDYGGKKISSVGAFLTAIKVKSPEIQDLILKMSQDNLKQVSKNITPKYQIRNLYWNGKVIKRDSKEYQELLDRAYTQRYKSDFEFRKALASSKGAKLIHTRGKTDIAETILTQDEFLQRLNKLRADKNLKYRIIDFVLTPFYKVKAFLSASKDKISEIIKL